MKEESPALVIRGDGNAGDAPWRLAGRTKRRWPKELPHLIQVCWDHDLRYRPEMREATARLERCIDNLLLQLNRPLPGGGGGEVHGFRKIFDPLTLAESQTTPETAPTSSAHPSSAHPAHNHDRNHEPRARHGLVAAGRDPGGKGRATDAPPSRGADRDARQERRRRSSATHETRARREQEEAKGEDGESPASLDQVF